MRSRWIGVRSVSAIGLGCMNLSHAYGAPPSRDQARRLILRAVDLGVTHLDTAALYGFGANEELLGEVLPSLSGRVHVATKCGMRGVAGRRVIDGRPETLRATVEESLRRLRIDSIDLLYLHRWDKAVPIEDSVGELARMVVAGKVQGIGLSEVSVETLRRAYGVCPLVAVQSEYSLWTRNPELGILDECLRLGIAFVAFSPLGRGFLAARLSDPSELAEGDLRRSMPRFQKPHWEANRPLLESWSALARETGCTPAQLALAWLLHKAPNIVPIPGTTSLAHLEENVAASDLRLADTVVRRMEGLLNEKTVSGPRYPASTLAEIDSLEFAAH